MKIGASCFDQPNLCFFRPEFERFGSEWVSEPMGRASEMAEGADLHRATHAVHDDDLVELERCMSR